jgi:hypothetical protein
MNKLVLVALVALLSGCYYSQWRQEQNVLNGPPPDYVTQD